MIKAILLLFAGFALYAPAASRADQVLMENGDRINGTVLSLSTNNLVIQNVNLGTVTLARAKVSAIFFGTAAASLPRAVPSDIIIAGKAAPQSASTSGLASALRALRDQTNLIQQVQTQILGSSSPDAINKFNELLDGLSTGKIDINGLRAQAQSAADQLRAFKKEMGPATAVEADAYLAILDQFLRDTAPGIEVTNSAAP